MTTSTTKKPIDMAFYRLDLHGQGITKNTAEINELRGLIKELDDRSRTTANEVFGGELDQRVRDLESANKDRPTLLDQARDHDPDAPVDRQKHSTRAWVREYPTADAAFGMAPVPRSVVSGIAKDLYLLEKRFNARESVMVDDYHHLRNAVSELMAGDDPENQRMYDVLEALEVRIRELEGEAANKKGEDE